MSEKCPLVETSWNLMIRVIWDLIIEKLILASLDLTFQFFDLGMDHRDKNTKVNDI